MLTARLTLLCLLAACSAGPADSQSAYPQRPAVSDAQGHPHDTATFYFPAADSLHATYVPPSQRPAAYVLDERVLNCSHELTYASYALTCFEAPVLSNYYLGAETYRFLWLRSFHRPVLLTLRRETGGAAFLRTQLLDKWPGFSTLTVFHPDSLPPTSLPEERARARRYYDETMADPEFRRQMTEGKRRAAQVKAAETVRALTPQQWQQFQKLLTDSGFQQSPACQPQMILDGVYWLLEAHQPNGYHLVFRHSPNKQDPFRQACE